MSEIIKRHPVFLSLLTMAVLATALLWTATSITNTPQAAAADPPPVPVRDILHRAGVDAATLCSLGLDSDDTNAVVLACGAKARIIESQLAIKDEAFAIARADFIALRRKAQSGTASGSEMSELASSTSDAAQLRSDIEELLESVVSISGAILTQNEETTLDALIANSGLPLATEFCGTLRTDEDNAALRDALSQEGFAAANGEDLDQAMQTLLTSERADTAVSLATTSLANDLATVETAWETACATYE